MIIFMAGYPFAGKSTLLEVFRQNLKQADYEAIIISPKDYRTDDYETLDEDSKRDMNLAAWECSLELLAEQIKENKDDSIVIYDTSCASLYRMQDYFKLAKKYSHYVIYCYINADLLICENRADGKWFNSDIIDKYKMNFKESVPILTKLADKAIVINNNVEINVSKLVGVFNDRISKSSKT